MDPTNKDIKVKWVENSGGKKIMIIEVTGLVSVPGRLDWYCWKEPFSFSFVPFVSVCVGGGRVGCC